MGRYRRQTIPNKKYKMTSYLQHSARLSFLTLAAFSLTLSACASKPERRGPPTDQQRGERPARASGTFLQPIAVVFAGMDANGDKVISRAEMQSGVTTEWSRFRQKPSAAYFSEWSLKSLGSIEAMPTFLSVDKDFNGVITDSEFTQQFERAFDRMDKDNDGRLERSEMIIAFNAPEGQRAGRGGGDGERGGRGGRGGGGGGRGGR